MERLSTAADIMVPKPITVTPETRVLDAIAKLLSKKVTGAPVVDSDRLYQGVFAERSAMEALTETARRHRKDFGQLPEVKARDVMSTELVTLSPDMDAFQAISKLLDNRISGAAVVDADRRLLGMFSERTSMSVLLGAAYDQLPTTEVSAFMDPGKVVDENTGLLELAETFIETHFRRLLVLRDERLVGQISRRDVLKAALDLAGSAPYYLHTARNPGDLPELRSVARVMDVNARTITPDLDLLRIATIFRSTFYRRLPVLSGRRLAGLVSRRDVLQATLRMMVKSPQKEKTFLYFSAVAGREAVNLD